MTLETHFALADNYDEPPEKKSEQESYLITQAESDADNYIETALNNINYLPITSGMQLYLETSKQSFKKKFDREMSPQEQLLYSDTFFNKIRTLKNNPNYPVEGDRKIRKS